MIFVTVGTHEQPFDRLVKKIDFLKKDGLIKEDVFIQYGFSNYIPTYCEGRKFVEYKKMIELIKNAHIVITHGGPASFIMAINEHKVPIVVPRMFSFGEHINNHQVDFVKKVAENKRNIIPVYNIDSIEDIIENYDKKMNGFGSNINFKNNQKQFMEKFEKVINDLIK